MYNIVAAVQHIDYPIWEKIHLAYNNGSIYCFRHISYPSRFLYWRESFKLNSLHDFYFSFKHFPKKHEGWGSSFCFPFTAGICWYESVGLSLILMGVTRWWAAPDWRLQQESLPHDWWKFKIVHFAVVWSQESVRVFPTLSTIFEKCFKNLKLYKKVCLLSLTTI